MKAETAYNVVNALSESEKERFYAMLGIVPAKIGKPNKLSNEATTEWLLKTIKNVTRDN